MPLIPFQFDAQTVDLILEGLSHLPYRRSADAINSIAQHARETLNPPKPARKAKPKAPKE
jgi:hypothetical protein